MIHWEWALVTLVAGVLFGVTISRRWEREDWGLVFVQACVIGMALIRTYKL